MPSDELTQLKTRLDSIEQEVFKNKSVSLQSVSNFLDTSRGNFQLPKRDSLPSNCRIGELVEVSGVEYLCTAQDTWTKIMSGSRQYTAGETLSANDPVRVVITASQTYSSFTSVASRDLPVHGASGDNEKHAFPFTIPAGGSGLTTVSLKLKKASSPADNYKIALNADSAGSPSGTDLESFTEAASALTTSYVQHDYTFTRTGANALTAGTYWIVISRSGARDTSNFVQVEADDGQSGGKKMNTGAWGAESIGTMNCATSFVDGTAGQIKKAYANISFYTLGLVGFTTAAITSGSSGGVQSLGYLDGFSGLTRGTQYLKDNATIGSTAGTVSLKVGTAISATEILILILA